jgi:hypothetical protein
MRGSFTITIGTTPVRLVNLLKGTAFSGASVQGSRSIDPNASELVSSLLITADEANSGTVYGHQTRSDVSSSDYGFKLEATEQRSYSADVPNIGLGLYLVGSGAGQKLHIEFRR